MQQVEQEASWERGGRVLRRVLSTSARGRRRPGAVLQTPAPSDALHGVAAKTRVRRHVPELEHRPPHHPVGHVEGGATGHPCTTAQDGTTHELTHYTSFVVLSLSL